MLMMQLYTLQHLLAETLVAVVALTDYLGNDREKFELKFNFHTNRGMKVTTNGGNHETWTSTRGSSEQ